MPGSIQAGAANMAGLPEGAAITRRQRLRRDAAEPIDLSRRGTLRAVSGGSRQFVAVGNRKTRRRSASGFDELVNGDKRYGQTMR